MTEHSRWLDFYDTDLKPMMEGLRAKYRGAIDLNQINDTERLKVLLIADKVAQDIEHMFTLIAADGKVIEHTKDHIERLEQLPERKRRILDKIGFK